MVCDTPPSQDTSTHQIYDSYLKEYRRYEPDTERDKRTDVLTVGLLVGTYSVRINSQESVSTQKIPDNFYGINLILSSLYIQMRFIPSIKDTHTASLYELAFTATRSVSG